MKKCIYLIMHLSLFILLEIFLGNVLGYLITVNDTTPEGFAIFDGSVLNSKQPFRKYYMNVEKSASFVEKLIYVNAYTGIVYLKQSLSCDGIYYPNIFTLYIDSTSNGIYEYVSIPLKIYIQGCEDNNVSSGNTSYNFLIKYVKTK